MPDTALIIMARYPEAGKTKTRLARTLGDEAVAGLYRAFLTDLARRFAGPRYALYWAYTPAEVDYQSFVQTLAPEQAQYMHSFPQQGSDFGTRLHAAFQWTHQRGYRRTILIGSDSPQIGSALIAQAESALDDADVVLGPAEDGGYYLIAMRQPHDVFSGIPMSTNVVARMTLEAAARQHLSTRLLDSLFDIDELPDLLRLAHLLDADSALASDTANYLKNALPLDMTRF
ncbi:MAG TPA: TIGR04282 family arsenosugar biosynthesis glycosyltransferase [Ktedonobacteraceae bacterium]|nr:TIGR04282 family arsenosugar biosynthesis glycosyltransferase [Ktedonobacteraceae bacterium]